MLKSNPYVGFFRRNVNCYYIYKRRQFNGANLVSGSSSSSSGSNSISTGTSTSVFSDGAMDVIIEEKNSDPQLQQQQQHVSPRSTFSIKSDDLGSANGSPLTAKTKKLIKRNSSYDSLSLKKMTKSEHQIKRENDDESEFHDIAKQPRRSRSFMMDRTSFTSIEFPERPMSSVGHVNKDDGIRIREVEDNNVFNNNFLVGIDVGPTVIINNDGSGSNTAGTGGMKMKKSSSDQASTATTAAATIFGTSIPNSPQIFQRGQNAWIIKPGPLLQDKYDVQTSKILGRGTYSVVRKCIHKESGREFAVKSIEKKYLFSDEEKAMVKREVEIQRLVNHPNVIRLYDTFEDDKFLHLIVDFASSVSLEEYLQIRGAAFGLSEIETCYIAEHILHGIEYIHGLGILHADLKPQNLLLHECKSNDTFNDSMLSSMKKIGRTSSIPALSSLVIKICDFGLARRVPDVRYFKLTGDVHKVPPTQISGTVGYIAPEIMRGEPYGQAADIWSVGIIIYELLSGVKPFSPYSDCLLHDVKFPKSIWAGKSAEVINLLTKMLNRDPAKRITARDALNDGWIHHFKLL